MDSKDCIYIYTYILSVEKSLNAIWFPKLQVQVRKHCQPYSNSNPIISSYLISYSMKSNQIMWALSWYLFEAFSKSCSHVYETGMKEGPNTFLLPLVDRTFSVAGFGGSWWVCEGWGAIPAIQKQRLSMALWPQVHFLFLETMLQVVCISSIVPWTSGLYRQTANLQNPTQTSSFTSAGTCGSCEKIGSDRLCAGVAVDPIESCRLLNLLIHVFCVDILRFLLQNFPCSQEFCKISWSTMECLKIWESQWASLARNISQQSRRCSPHQDPWKVSFIPLFFATAMDPEQFPLAPCRQWLVSPTKWRTEPWGFAVGWFH